MPGSLLACLLVNPLQPQQNPSGASAKCWPPLWALLWQWSVLLWLEHHWGVGGPSDPELHWMQVKYLEVVSMIALVHHLGWDRIPCQDTNTKKNVWERMSAFQTLMVAYQSVHIAKTQKTYSVTPAMWIHGGSWADTSPGSHGGGWTQLWILNKPHN